ncbi:membrane protein insertase YidC [Candidatus Babeliales bacterium]|nr:membrane protein insertase YidC [Candidatus Babeliales bacterium]
MDRKLIFALLMTTIVMGVFNYMTYRKEAKQQAVPEAIQAGQSYKVPSKADLMRPLNYEIDFIDKKVTKQEEIESVETDFYKIDFTNYGGNISRIAFKKRLGKGGIPLQSVKPKDFFNREESCFLLALDEKTPYFYKFDSKEDLGDRVNIIYEAETSNFAIKKIYSIFRGSYKINLNLEFNPKGRGTIHPRIFLPAPFISELSEDLQNGFVFNKQSQKIEASLSVVQDNAWLIPEVFGAQDKYFAHALVKDDHGFAIRGYFKKDSTGKYISIFEGPEVLDKKSFTLSFYIGPKDIADMAAVDGRLEDLLNFGWLSWLCKLLLKLLEFVYKFIGNFGLAIIILTVLIKLIFLPLSIKGTNVMEQNQKLQPQVTRIKKKFAHDVQLQQQELMRFYKEQKISPVAPVFGCLPLLIDVVIMIGLYRVLGSYMDLYQAPFGLWITDLSSKDPFYVLPILMGISMFWQQKLSPVGDERTKIMMSFLPLVMTGVFASMPSGVVLYWLIKNILTVGETYLRKSLKKA